jgi:glycosyltransferase involved in cell wall biosynthesis
MENDPRSEDTKDRLLSICIPTFNRAEYLRNTLNSITGQDRFLESCEVVISDNSSNDNTRAVGEHFADRFDNVRYYCSKENVGAERNFLRLLDYGQGKYLKLQNDKACFCKNGLSELVEHLENIDHNVVFLLNGNIRHKRGIIDCKSLDEFVKTVSFWSTWMCGIIFKRAEYRRLEEKDRAVGSSLVQTDIMFRLVSQSSGALVINKRLMYEQELKSKDGYNLFRVFVGNYLTLYEDYLQRGILSREVYKEEKRSLLRNFIFPLYTAAFLKRDKRFRFGLAGAHGEIVKYYYREPGLYLYPLHLMRSVFRRLTNKGHGAVL